jgi:WhiB family redox-sensing transcriptional regulator
MEEPLATAPTFDGTQICMKVDPEIFFPELHPNEVSEPGDQRRYKAAVKNAKELCNGCVHLVPCLEYALLNAVEGIWGGTTETERKHLRRLRKINNPQSVTLFINEAVKQKRRP